MCDALISSLLDVAWSRPEDRNLTAVGPFYDENTDFNDNIDSEYPLVKIAGSAFAPIRILFALDHTQYEAARDEWLLADNLDSIDEEAVA